MERGIYLKLDARRVLAELVEQASTQLEQSCLSHDCINGHTLTGWTLEGVLAE